MVDGVLLLVDAAEGPLPQTRYVLSKALALDLPAVVVLNKVDRADARPDEVLDEVEQLFMDLGRRPRAARLPGRLGGRPRGPGRSRASACRPPTPTWPPLLDTVLDAIPAPDGDPDAPLQALVTNLDASDYLGRLAIGRVVKGVLRPGDPVALLDEESTRARRRCGAARRQLLAFDRHRPGRGRRALAAGDLFVVAGFPEVEIGDTIAAPTDPKPLPRLIVDEPVLRMTFGVNTSPLAGGRAASSPSATCASASSARCWATSRSAWRTPTRPTCSRSPAGASCSWPC